MKRNNVKKSHVSKFLGLVILLNLQTIAYGQGLAGDYVVGSAPADFSDLDSALTELSKQGMAKPVKFLLKPEEHVAHVSIDTIPRLGLADDLLTITSLDDGQPATMFHEAIGSADNWVIRLNGVAHVMIRDLILEARGNSDFATIVLISDDTLFIQIQNNIFSNYFPSISADPGLASSLVADAVADVSDIDVIGNQFNSGGGAIYMTGLINNRITNLTIVDNSFNEQMGSGSFYALKMLNVTDLTIIANTITNNQDNAKGIDLFRIYGAIVDANQIAMLGGGNGGLGMKLSYHNAIGVEDSVVSNNFISASKTAVHIASNNSRIKLLHNSIVAREFSTIQPNHALRVGSINNEDIEIINNIIQSRNTQAISKVMEIEDSTAILESNHNVFKGETTMDFEFTVNGNNFPAFADYQASTFFDDQSLDKAINFVNEGSGDMHLSVIQYNDPDLKTVALVEARMDIDGEWRSPLTPLIGADDLYSDLIFNSDFE